MASLTAFIPFDKGSHVKYEKSPVHLEALTHQLGFLKSRIQEPGAAHWRKMGKLAQDFTVWLERAKPWISTASNLIALRVEQVMGEVEIERPSQNCLEKLSDLLEEAGRQLTQPGLPIQVIDLQKKEKTVLDSSSESCFIPGGVALPSTLVEIPELLRPKGNVPVQFLYIIPN